RGRLRRVSRPIAERSIVPCLTVRLGARQNTTLPRALRGRLPKEYLPPAIFSLWLCTTLYGPARFYTVGEAASMFRISYTSSARLRVGCTSSAPGQMLA